MMLSLIKYFEEKKTIFPSCGKSGIILRVNVVDVDRYLAVDISRLKFIPRRFADIFVTLVATDE